MQGRSHKAISLRASTVALAVVAVVLVAGCSGKTTGATNVADSSATLNAVGSCDTACSAYMRWRKAGTTTWTNAPSFDVNSKVTNAQWHQDANGLAPSTAYEYQACGKETSYSGYVCVGPDGGTGSVDKFTTTAARLQPGFSESKAFSGLTEPTALRFSPDGRVFVAEKSGLIKVFDSLQDTTPTVFANLRTEVHNYWDRGLLGLALDPKFPAQPYVYALYTYDAAIGETAPRWGSPGATSDGCPTPPGPTTDGCVVSGRLSRLTASGDKMTGDEQVLVNDWCQQFPSHSIGDLVFGADGALYVSGGDGAAFTTTDYGQLGGNPCGDPPAGVGGTQTPPGAEGGALRSQSLLRPTGESRVLDGAVLRVDPNTGDGLSDNPLAASPDPDARRVVAYGLRNPFRFVLRPGTGELWVGDVGWNAVEEVNRLANPIASPVEDFGWPCYEGPNPQPSYQSLGLNICESLYGQPGAVTPPFFRYNHANRVVARESCPTGSSSTTGLAFYTKGPYPQAYNGALFFADHSRDCIWAMQRSGSPDPSPSHIKTFVAQAFNPVDLQIGPDGNLYYLDFDGGTVRRISYKSGNQTPTAIAKATPTSGSVPLTVSFDATGSSDPDPGDTLTYSWDLDGDGTYGDSTASRPSFTYASPGVRNVGLRVTDPHGASATDTIAISVGNTPPTATITNPTSALTWAVGDPIDFSGSAADAQDGALPASALSWSVILHHCPSNCHTHLVQDFDGVSDGSFNAPDHDYPSYLELRLTATDSGGLTDVQSVRLDPQTVSLTLQSNPSGLSLTQNGSSAPTPFTRTVILNSGNTLSAPGSQTQSGTTYDFKSWSDGGAATHSVTAAGSATYTATYAPR
jgi:glucose/arabinose dehydrogenase